MEHLPTWASSEWFVAVLMMTVGLSFATRETIIKHFGAGTQTVFNSNAFGVILFGPILFFVPVPNAESFIWILLGGIALGLGMTTRLLAYQTGDAGAVYPVYKAVQSLAMVLFGFSFFQETLSIMEYVAVAIVLVSMAAVYWRKRDGTPRLNITLVLVAFAGIALAAYSLFDAIGVRQTNLPFSYIPYTVVISSAVAMLITVIRNGVGTIPEFTRSWKKDFWPGVLGNSNVMIEVYVLYVAAMAEVMIYAKSSIIFIYLFGIIFLKEQLIEWIN